MYVVVGKKLLHQRSVATFYSVEGKTILAFFLHSRNCYGRCITYCQHCLTETAVSIYMRIKITKCLVTAEKGR